MGKDKEIPLSDLEEKEPENKDNEIEEREVWGNKLDFLLTCVGYAVGFGNVWRFPNLCFENGGGAFLIPYFIFLALCGMPLFFMELSLSQYIGIGPIGIWKAVSPLLQGIGYAMLILSFLCCVYYNTIIAWTLFYLFQSFRSDVPWRDCGNTWNTEDCYAGKPADSDGIVNQTMTNFLTNLTSFQLTCAKNYKMVFADNTSYVNRTVVPSALLSSIPFNCSYVEPVKRVLPTEEYLNNYVWQITETIADPGGVRWELCLCLLASWVLVYFCIWKGVKSVGKVVYVTATFPYLVLFILMIRGATLPGSLKGVTYFLAPDFAKLGDPQVWVRAAGQIFYSLGVGFGSLVAMGSYNKFKNNCYRDAVMVSLINCGTSVFCGFVVFSVLGHMAFVLDMDIAQVAKSGPGLVFAVYPDAIARMPLSPLWAILFFLMLITLGLDSQFAMIEVVISGLADEYPRYLRKYKEIFILVMCIIAFFLAIPTVTRAGPFVVELFNTQAGGLSLLFLAFFESIAIGWVYGADRLLDNIESMIGYRPCKWWAICWKYFSPIIILITFLYGLIMWDGIKFGGGYVYPAWAEGLGWLLCFSSMICMPIGAIYTIHKIYSLNRYALEQNEWSWLSLFRESARPNETLLKQMELERVGNENDGPIMA